jgi:uncharacterized protein
MRLYSGTSGQFVEDTVLNQVAGKLRNAFFSHYRFNPSPAEINSWQNSLRAMALVLQHGDLMDHGVMLEYQLPMTSRRLDFMVTGKGQDSADNAVIVELKQWHGCEPADGENEVVTVIGGARREVLHPSAQVGRYRMYLSDTHTAFYEGDDPVSLAACAYLHNYPHDPEDALYEPKFESVLKSDPIFTMDDAPELMGYLQERLWAGRGLEVLKRVEESRYRPSRKLMDHVGQVINGDSRYVLLDEQVVAYDKVRALAKKGFHDRRKTAIIIKGGPGTGKSVIAIKLMADLLLSGYNAHYATGSKAFTETLRSIIGSRGSVQFKYFNSYATAQTNEIDVLIADESHRIRETSNSRFTPAANRSNLEQIEELLRAAKVCVFLIDDVQVVRPKEIGSVEYIRQHAEAMNCSIFEYELEAQFRCSGSDAFVNWIDNTLGIRRTANVLWEGNEAFDFRIFDSPQALEEVVRRKAAEDHTARMTAGFCWRWSNPRPDGTLVEDVVIGDYRRPWNARPEAARLARGIPKASLWAHHPGGIDQIGCIYTAQGFEFDYAGVIFGKDLVYRFDRREWVGDRQQSHDTVVRRSGERFVGLVKNTYRVLLSRGMKGCYVHFMDKETEQFFRSRMEIRESSVAGSEMDSL